MSPLSRLSKPVVLYSILSMVAASWALGGVSIYENQQLIEQGTESHKAVCAYRASVQRQYQDGLVFLSMTKAQRVKKYGKAFADLPPAVVLSSNARYLIVIKALSALHCGATA